MTRLRRTLLAVIVVLAIPGTAAAQTARPTRVLILGDSVMLGAASRYPVHLPGRAVTVDALVNRSTGQGAELIARRGADWDVVVILLGHNDAGSPGAYQPAAQRILGLLAGVPRVAWLTLHETRPTFAQVNRFLRAQPATHPNLWIADWNRTISQHPEATSSDGLHLRGTGPDLMAGFVADIVRAQEYLTANPPTTTTVPPTTTDRVGAGGDGAGSPGDTLPAPDAGPSPANDDQTRAVEIALLVAFAAGCGVWVVRRTRHRDPRLR